MIENLKHINDLNYKLLQLNDADLDQLYLRVFNSADGELVMQDLANRCFITEITGGDDFPIEYNEGMRSVWLSITNRLRSAVSPKVKAEE